MRNGTLKGMENYIHKTFPFYPVCKLGRSGENVTVFLFLLV